MARTDFRAAAARRLSEDRELSPAIVSLLSPDSPTRSVGVRIVPIDRIEPNPEQPRHGLRAGRARRAGRVDPRARRPPADPRPPARTEHLPDRRRRASLARIASRPASTTIPALIEDIDDDTALEIAIIENLQREDLSPLDEAAMYDRMVHEHGYSIRKLADKLGKDKGYLENRLRLADAPPEIRELVSLRKDSLSHAYELMKVEDPKKRRRLAEQVARGELTLIKLRDKIEGRRARPAAPIDDVARESPSRRPDDEPDGAGPSRPRSVVASTSRARSPISDDSLVNAKQEPGRSGRGARRRPRRSRSVRGVDPGDGPGEPGEVPDDRQAQARERDRASSGATTPATEPSSPADLGRLADRPGQPAAASSADADGLELPGPLASRRGRRRRPSATPSATTTRAARWPRPPSRASTRPQASVTDAPRRRRRRAGRPRPTQARSAQAGPPPSRRRPPCRARGRRGRWRSRARPRPATATGHAGRANDAGSAPAAPNQPNTGSSGIPTANGSHDQAVPLSARS